jgi:DNA-binding response OmpR family regulator
MKGSILVVDDDPRTSRSVELYLRHAGYDVTIAADGNTALAVADATAPALLVLDLMLPGADGLDVCRTLRTRTSVPIIMLTARSTENDKLRGLEAGADDYMTKPFSPRELAARVGAVLRRARATGEVVRVGDVEIDVIRRQVRRRGVAVPVTPTEFRLLEALAAVPGRAFTRTELVDRAFGRDSEALERTIDVHVLNLRRKLSPPPHRGRGVITTVFGTGYRLEASSHAD